LDGDDSVFLGGATGFVSTVDLTGDGFGSCTGSTRGTATWAGEMFIGLGVVTMVGIDTSTELLGFSGSLTGLMDDGAGAWGALFGCSISTCATPAGVATTVGAVIGTEAGVVTAVGAVIEAEAGGTGEAELFSTSVVAMVVSGWGVVGLMPTLNAGLV